MGQILERLLNEILDFKIKRIFILLIIGVLMWFFLGAPFYDFYNIYKTEKQINLLHSVLQLDTEKVNTNPQLQKVYDNIVSNMQVENNNTESIFTDSTFELSVGKFISGALLFWLLVLLLPFIDYKEQGVRGKITAGLIVLFLSIIFGFIAYSLPTFKITPLNYILMPILEIGFIGYLVYVSMRQKK